MTASLSHPLTKLSEMSPVFIGVKLFASLIKTWSSPVSISGFLPDTETQMVRNVRERQTYLLLSSAFFLFPFLTIFLTFALFLWRPLFIGNIF